MAEIPSLIYIEPAHEETLTNLLNDIKDNTGVDVTAIGIVNNPLKTTTSNPELIMSEQTTYDLPDKRLLPALDKAHEQGFRDFLRDIGHDARCQVHRTKATNSLKDLINRLNKDPGPNYHDPYVAAAYIVKYHLWHCMMAYWVFKSIFDRIDIPDTLYVYDVAAGTGAGRVGLALALSEHQGQPNAYYTPSEPSKAMQSAGDCFWEAFRGSVDDNLKNHDSVPELPADTLKIVTAFHLSLPWEIRKVGEHTINSVQSEICRASPQLGLFTCHKDKWPSLRKVVVGDYYDWDREFKVSIPSGGNGVKSRSMFYTRCAPSLGFQVDEGTKVNTWSLHRFSLPSDSILFRCVSSRRAELLRQEREEAETEAETEHEIADETEWEQPHEEERLRREELDFWWGYYYDDDFDDDSESDVEQ